LTAWLAAEEEGGGGNEGAGVMQTCEQVSQSVVNEFRRNFQGRSPEPQTPRFTG
jgi:hypothetical protein